MLLNFNVNQLREYPEQTLTSTRTSSYVSMLWETTTVSQNWSTKLDLYILNPSLLCIRSISHQEAEPAKETATLHSLNHLKKYKTDLCKEFAKCHLEQPKHSEEYQKKGSSAA